MQAATRPIAEDALKMLAQMAKMTDQARLGYKDAADLARAELAPGLVQFIVRLDALRDFGPGKPALAIVALMDLVFYPVLAPSGGLSAIELYQREGEWKPASFGAPELARLVLLVRNAAVRREGVAAHEVFLVAIPSFNMDFAGFLRDGKLRLIPVQAYPEFKLKRAVAVDAGDPFRSMIAAARAHDELPR